MAQPHRVEISDSDRKIANYVSDFEQRFPAYEKMRRQYLREVGADPLSSFFVEHFSFGNVQVYEEQLHGMLTDEEAQRLRSNVEFTKAWRIFVKMRWAHKRLVRTLTIFVAVVVLPSLVFWAGWALMESVRSATTIGK